MNPTIVERSKALLLEVGAAPILYLMLALSIVSVAIMVERALFFVRTRISLPHLAEELATRLARGELVEAKELVLRSSSAEAAVVVAGLNRMAQGPAAVEEAMSGARVIQRMRLERRLGFLGTLGANAPFVGLLGTVIGIVQAFERLQTAGASGGATSSVMGAIAEALVATAIGLVVAIPAVAAFNAFQRRIKAILGNTEALTHIVLSHVKAVATPHSDSGSGELAPRTPAAGETSRVARFERLSAVPH
jgi:biopolymer transport protein ExbB